MSDLHRSSSSSKSGSLWHNEHFLKLWSGDIISSIGSQISLLAIPLLAITTLHAGPGAIGLLAGAQTLPALILTPLVGVWVDRYPRRLMLIWASFIQAALLGLVPVLSIGNALSFPYLYVIGFLSGCLVTILQIAYLSYMPTTVAPDQLLDANGKMGLTYSTAQTAGPGVAGLIIQAASAPVAVLIDALTYVFGGISILIIRLPERTHAQGQRTGYWSALVEGVRMAVGRRLLRWLAGVSAWFNLCEQAVLTLFLIYAVRKLGLRATELGVILAMAGVGGVIGSLVAPRLGRWLGNLRAAAIGIALSGASLIAVPMVSGSRLVVVSTLAAALVLYGLGLTVFNIFSVTLRQSLVPDDILGRVNASYRTVTYGAVPIGALVSGLVANMIGLRPALFVFVIGTAFGCLLFLSFAELRGRSWTQQMDEHNAPAGRPVL